MLARKLAALVPTTRLLPCPPVPDELRLDGATGSADKLRVTFLGNSTLLLRSGESALLTDGFFSRPGAMRSLCGRVGPNPAVIENCLDRAGISRLDAVVVSHSHYDHAMDAAYVAQSTGALLVGSESTAMVGRGGGLAPARLVKAPDAERMKLGRFTVTLLPSVHIPPVRFPGDIRTPVVPPVYASRYRVGPCYLLLIEHDGRRLAVQSSAGIRNPGLPDFDAEVLFLGVGTLGRKSSEYRDRYWRSIVEASGARRIILIHWDNFWRPLDEPLRPLPYGIDNFSTTVAFLRSRADRAGIDLRIPVGWDLTDPFQGLAAP